MASTSERPSMQSRESTSTDSDDDLSSHDPRPSLPRRQSSITFSRGTKTESRSPMSSRRQTSLPDEITPIRSADGNADRRYNTSGESEATGAQQETRSASLSLQHAQSSTSGKAKEAKDKLSWYKRVAEKYGAISLENKGSVARDHLALERTFLAWLRTSLAFASIGIAITQLFRLNTAVASHNKRHLETRQQGAPQRLPFSPLAGHAVSEELIQYLQWHSENGEQDSPPVTLGPTLMDQLLLLSPLNPDGTQNPAISAIDFTTSAFDEDAAAHLRHVGKPLGATFLAISIIILFVGFHRYFQSQYWIIRGKFPASRGSVALVGFIAGALIVASLVVVLVIAPASFEKK